MKPKIAPGNLNLVELGTKQQNLMEGYLGQTMAGFPSIESAMWDSLDWGHRCDGSMALFTHLALQMTLVFSVVFIHF